MVKGSVVWVNLDPARGAEVPKTRPCIVVSRTEANDVSSTVTISAAFVSKSPCGRSLGATASIGAGYFFTQGFTCALRPSQDDR